MMKRKLVPVVLVAILLAMTLSFAACDPKPPKPSAIELTGFELATQVEVEIGQIYELPKLTVTDQHGAVYVPEIKVVSNGAQIKVTANKFQIKTLSDHTVTYSIKVADGDVRSKSMTLVVKDKDVPTILFDSAAKRYYNVNDTLTALPSTSVVDNYDTNLTAETKLYFDDVEVKKGEKGWTLGTVGIYTVKASATDSSNNTGHAELTIYARVAGTSTEIEAFRDDYAGFSAIANDAGYELEGGLTKDSIGGTAPTDGGNFAYFGSKTAEDGAFVKYPGFKLTPRLDMIALSQLEDQGYDKVGIRWMHTSSVKRTLYQRWTGKQTNLGAIDPNEWHTTTASIGDLIKGYDSVMSGDQLMFYVSNDPEWAPPQEDFKVYVAGVFAMKAAEVSFGSDFATGTYRSGEKLDLTKLSLKAKDGALAVEGTVSYDTVITSPSGNKIKIVDQTELTLSEAGIYTVDASLVSGTHYGSARKSISVNATPEQVNAEVARLKAISDKTTAAFIASVNKLSLMHDSMAADEKAKYSKYEMAADVYGNTPVEDRALYTNLPMGMLQTVMRQTNASGDKRIANTYVQFNGAVSYDTTIKHGDDAGSLKIKTSVDTFYTSVNLAGAKHLLGDIKQYKSIEFYAYGMVKTGSADKPNNLNKYGVRLHDGSVDSDGVLIHKGNPIDAAQANGEWAKVSFGLEDFADWDKVNIGFRAADWNNFHQDSVLYISSVNAIPKAELKLPSAFVPQDVIQGQTYALSGMEAYAMHKNEAVTEGLVYKVTLPNSTTKTLSPSDSFTFDLAGEYVFSVDATSGPLKGMRDEYKVNALTRVELTLADFNTLMNNMLATEDKDTEAYAANVEKLWSAYVLLSDADRATVNVIRYNLAKNGQNLVDNKLMYFDSAIANMQASLGAVVNSAAPAVDKTALYDLVGTGAYTETVPKAIPADAKVNDAFKITVTDTRTIYNLAVRFTNLADNILTLDKYSAIEFYFYADAANNKANYVIRGYSNNMTQVTKTDPANNKDLTFAKGAWHKVTLALSDKMMGWNDFSLRIIDAGWGNIGTNSVFYLTPVHAVPKTAAAVTFDQDLASIQPINATLGIIATAHVYLGTALQTATIAYSVKAPGAAEAVAATADYVFDKVGVYEVTATVTDGVGKDATVTKKVVVGHIQTLDVQSETIKVFDMANVALASTKATNEVKIGKDIGGRTGSFIGATSYKESVKDDVSTKTPTGYPGLRTPFNITLEQLLQLKAEGYKDLTVDVYLDGDEARTVYMKWNTTQVNLGALTPKTWMTLTYKDAIDPMISYYEWFRLNASELFFIGNDTAPKLEFVAYLDNIVLTKPSTQA